MADVFDCRLNQAGRDAYWRESEYMVDSMATALARVPGFMPAWPTKKEARASGHTNQEP